MMVEFWWCRIPSHYKVYSRDLLCVCIVGYIVLIGNSGARSAGRHSRDHRPQLSAPQPFASRAWLAQTRTRERRALQVKKIKGLTATASATGRYGLENSTHPKSRLKWVTTERETDQNSNTESGIILIIHIHLYRLSAERFSRSAHCSRPRQRSDSPAQKASSGFQN